MAKRRRHGPRKGSEVFRVRSDRYVWRKPAFDHGAWRVRRRDIHTGKITMVTLEATTPTEAKDEVHRLVNAEKEERTNPKPREGKLLADAFDEWLKTFTMLSPATVIEYESEVNTFKEAFGKDRLVMEVDYDLVEEVFTQTWRGAKPRTILKKYGKLRSIWGWFLKKRYAVTDPITMYTPEKRLRQEDQKAKRGSGRRLNEEECRRLIAAAAEPTRTAIVLSLLTGLRLSNTVGSYQHKRRGITWGNIDWETKALRLPGTMMKNHEDFAQPLSDQLHAYLKARLRQLGSVPAPESQIVTPHDHKLRWKRAVEKSGIVGNVRWHDQRHTFGAAFGKGDAEARALLGHFKTSSVTAGYTDHQFMEDLKKRLNQGLPKLIDVRGQIIPPRDLTTSPAKGKLIAK
jgi:site-specific recombinase XerD